MNAASSVTSEPVSKKTLSRKTECVTPSPSIARRPVSKNVVFSTRMSVGSSCTNAMPAPRPQQPMFEITQERTVTWLPLMAMPAFSVFATSTFSTTM